MKFSRQDYDNRIIDTKNLIPEDEPVFLLRSTDSLAPRLLLQWAMELRLAGGDPDLAKNAEAHAQKMLDWQKIHKAKTPDQVIGSNKKKFLLDKLKEHLRHIYNTKEINLKEFNLILSAYYDNDPNVLEILIPSDLKEDCRGISLDDLEFDNFKFDTTEMINLYSKKIILFISSDKKCVILKSEIEYDR